MSLLRALAPWGVLLVLPGCVSLGAGGATATGPLTGAVAYADTGQESTGGLARSSGASLGPAFQGLSAAERQIAAQAQEDALDSPASGQPVHWRSPRSGAQGAVVAGPLYIVNAQRCRDFTHSIEISGRVSTDGGVVCREGGGGWQRVG